MPLNLKNLLIYGILKRNQNAESTNVTDENKEESDTTQNSIYKMQSKKNNELNIEEDQTLTQTKLKLLDCMTLQKMD